MTTFAPLESERLGDIRITHLPDGSGFLDATMLLPPSTEADWEPYRHWLNDDGGLYISVGGILVETPTVKIMIDPGVGPQVFDSGPMGSFAGGELLTSLDKVGLEPSDIDIVTFTHLHVDHTGWITLAEGEAGNLVFPNARHVVMDREWDYWRSTDDPLRASVAPVLDVLKGTVEHVPDGGQLCDGVTLRSSAGHTPGHAMVQISGGSSTALVLGDAMHSGAQVAHCDWHCVGDVDGDLASRTRAELVEELSAADTFGLVAHLPNSIFGHVVNAGGQRRWVEGRGDR